MMTLVRRLPHTQTTRVQAARAFASLRRPELPAAQELDVRGAYKIKYIDLPPPARPSPTIVLIHGSPGSYQDFKYLIPHLQEHARVIGINLPGNGGSQVLDRANYYDNLRAINLGHAAHDAIAQLVTSQDDVFVLGHSFGGHATVNVAAINEKVGDVHTKINIRGVALLAPASLRPHRALQFGNIGMLWKLLTSDFPLVEQAGQALTRALYTRIWRFPAKENTEHYVAGLVRCASTDFGIINDHVSRVKDVPAFIAWARDDAFIEEEVFQELSEACHPGPRFAFERGGHNIQKTKAEFLAHQLLQWTHQVTQGDASSHSRDIQMLP